MVGKPVEETNIVKGFVDDATDMIGFHRPDEYLPTPADLLHALGLPTLKEAIPSPKDVGDAITKNVRLRAPMPPSPREVLGRFPGT
jgi:hypothetical protein